MISRRKKKPAPPNLAAGSLQNKSKIMTQKVNTEHALVTLRGGVTGAGTKTRGEGFTVVKNSTGKYTVTYASIFGDTPVVVVGLYNPGPTLTGAQVVPEIISESTSAFVVWMKDSGGNYSNYDCGFMFTSTGMRGPHQ